MAAPPNCHCLARSHNHYHWPATIYRFPFWHASGKFRNSRLLHLVPTMVVYPPHRIPVDLVRKQIAGTKSRWLETRQSSSLRDAVVRVRATIRRPWAVFLLSGAPLPPPRQPKGRNTRSYALGCLRRCSATLLLRSTPAISHAVGVAVEWAAWAR